MPATPTAGGGANFLPVGQLSTYSQRWVIAVAVLSKNATTFDDRNNKKAKLLTCDLIDIQGDVISAKFWTEAAQKYEAIFEVGKVYSVKGGKVTVANKRYNRTAHAYELTFYDNAYTEVVPLDKATQAALLAAKPDITTWPSAAKASSYNFVPLRTIKTMNRELPFTVDVLGVVHTVQEEAESLSKSTGKAIRRRTLTLVDDSEHELEVTVWPPLMDTTEAMFSGHSVVAFRGLQIREWRGRVAATTSSTTIALNPSEVEKTQSLKSWYAEVGHDIAMQPLKNEASTGVVRDGVKREPATPATLSEIFTEVSAMDPGMEGKVYVATAMPMRCFYKNKSEDVSVFFTACSRCKRKLHTDTAAYSSATATSLRCEACHADVHPSYRYIMALSLIDSTRGRFVLRAFHQQCELLLGLPAPVVRGWSLGHETNDCSTDEGTSNRTTATIEKYDKLSPKDKLAALFEYDALWKPIKIRVRGRREVYEGKSRNNVVAVWMESVNYENEAFSMLRDIWTVFPEARKKNVPRSAAYSAESSTAAKKHDSGFQQDSSAGILKSDTLPKKEKTEDSAAVEHTGLAAKTTTASPSSKQKSESTGTTTQAKVEKDDTTNIEAAADSAATTEDAAIAADDSTADAEDAVTEPTSENVQPVDANVCAGGSGESDVDQEMREAVKATAVVGVGGDSATGDTKVADTSATAVGESEDDPVAA